MRVKIFVQARVGSTRLPGKVLMQVMNQPLLHYQIERLKRVKNSEITLLTTEDSQDDQIVDFCLKEKVPYFRGPTEDVLTRFFKAATPTDTIVRITSDCPLIDSQLIENVIEAFQKTPCDYASNCLKRSYPRGMDVEIFSYQALKTAYEMAISPNEREHVTLYIYQHPEKFRLKNVESTLNLSHLRLTVDTKEDFELIKLLLENLYPKNPTFTLEDILKALQQHPEWVKINAHIAQKTA